MQLNAESEWGECDFRIIPHDQDSFAIWKSRVPTRIMFAVTFKLQTSNYSNSSNSSCSNFQTSNSSNAEHRTQNTEHGTRNAERGTQNTEHGTQNKEQRTRNAERLTLPFPLPVPGRRNAHYFGKSPAKIRSVLKTKFRIDIRNLHF